jgi:hypothetical protein
VTVGAGNVSAIVTLVERTTRVTLLGHLPDAKHDSAPMVRDAVVAALADLPAHLRRTLTWDQGKEMAHYAEVAAALGTTKVSFCDPRERPRTPRTPRDATSWTPPNRRSSPTSPRPSHPATSRCSTVLWTSTSTTARPGCSGACPPDAHSCPRACSGTGM